MKPQDNNNNEEIDLKELFFELLAHWKMILASTLLVALIAFVYSKFLITPMYESTAKLYIDTKSTSLTSLADLQMGTSLANDYVEIVTSRPVLEKVIEDLNIKETYRTLGSRVSLKNPTNSRILEITVKDSDPEIAKTLADKIAEVSAQFIAEKMNQTAPNIIQEGYSDGQAVSPSKTKNTIIGALVGLVISAGFVVIAYLINDTIMTPDDVEKKLGLHYLGSLPLDVIEGDGDKKKNRLKEKKNA